MSASPFALNFEKLSVRFGHHDALKDVTLRVPENAILAIIGPNGAGKSTLMKVALGLIQPTFGEVLVLGQAPKKTARQLGYVPQLKTYDRSFPATVLELVVSGQRRSWPARIKQREKDQALWALEQVGATHLRARSLSGLSGGELQRTFLARALVKEPKLILLDEPATGVDATAEHDLYDLLEGYQNSHATTVAMITHDLTAARYHASQVAVLNTELLAYGPPAEVFASEGLKRAFGHLGHHHGSAI